MLLAVGHISILQAIICSISARCTLEVLSIIVHRVIMGVARLTIHQNLGAFESLVEEGQS